MDACSDAQDCGGSHSGNVSNTNYIYTLFTSVPHFIYFPQRALLLLQGSPVCLDVVICCLMWLENLDTVVVGCWVKSMIDGCCRSAFIQKTC